MPVEPTAGRLDDIVTREVDRRVPGLALNVAAVEGTVLERSWGFADRADGTAMRPDTACNWFSMTKPVTASVAVRLAEDGLLDLDAPVADLWPPFAMARSTDRAGAVTVRHLLSHSSGLTNPYPLRWVRRADRSGPDRGTWVRSVLEAHSRLRFDPGSRAAYSNLGYLVAGEVIAAVTGASFEQAARSYILEPLEMGSTGFVAPPGVEWATPHQRRRTAANAALRLLVPGSIIGRSDRRFRALHHFVVDGPPFGGLVGPVTDAARFARAHLGDGELDGVQIVSAAAARTMRTPHATGRGLRVGLGWHLLSPTGSTGTARGVEHLGGGAGYWSCMRLLPDEGLCVVVMGNATRFDHDAVVRAAVGDALSSGR